MPELATSLIAARRGHGDIAIGNVVGSNIFNVLLILGASGLARPLDVGGLRESAFELGALAVMTVIGVIFIRTERQLTRLEGSILIGLYVVFVVMAARPA